MIKFISILIVAFFTGAAFAGPAKKASVKAPAKGKPKVSNNRKVSSIRYNKFKCKITRHTRDGSSSEPMTLTDVLKFTGVEKHEEVTLTNKDGKYTLSVNVFMETPATPYLVDRFECDEYMGCQGERRFFNRKGIDDKPFQIVAGGQVTHGVLGSEDVFRFSSRSKGFHFTAIQMNREAGAYFGVEATCLGF